ncbi:hypothetical protein E4633_01235 [Geomonas terrae]|uniref:Uncharacterized protein n=1 Tax=Geomonas terrae TaxID=2562681 RepID=A0A4S1CK81_9BACT|nr:hypothetical protein E4633_01235 [Geomonas terrae]
MARPRAPCSLPPAAPAEHKKRATGNPRNPSCLFCHLIIHPVYLPTPPPVPIEPVPPVPVPVLPPVPTVPVPVPVVPPVPVPIEPVPVPMVPPVPVPMPVPWL